MAGSGSPLCAARLLVGGDDSAVDQGVFEVRLIGRHSKTRSTTPRFTQRRKRWKTLFQLPKSLGRSRQGRPFARATAPPQGTADCLWPSPQDRRPCRAARPIFSQTASPTMNRDLSSIAPTPPKRRLQHDPSAGGIDRQQALVRRAWGLISSGRRSTKVRRVQAALRQ